MLFPLLYLTLELPKRIINDAIGSDGTVRQLDETAVYGIEQITGYGVTLTQVQYLWVLCGFFLLAVTCHGLLKMRINTMKGVLAERLLRRFRFTLISRILRFPQPYFERTSQGELVSMVTAESEPMGGLMGDAVAQPVLQAGQMLTILGFLFAQSVTFGAAACALIPLQAWLIPKLQRQINLLNRKRVIQVRALAAEIGEGAAGASTLRVNAGWRFRMAMITDRLGRLFAIRFDIYRKKFFMKFINNFITQLTPFLFYAFGGYLVIQGEISLGSLVAALAAYKDLSSPWKELLTFYNQSADMSLRWETITERFAPSGMVAERLMREEPSEIPRLTGDIRIGTVTVRDADGNEILDSIDAVLPGGGLIGITAPNDEDRRALAETITREVVPASGSVSIGEHDLTGLHQITIATRVGHANSRPVLFQGTFGDNLFMPIRFKPNSDAPEITGDDDAPDPAEAARAGNSADRMSQGWGDPGRGGADSEAQLRDTWCDMIERIGGAGALLRRALDQRIDPEQHPQLAEKLIGLRSGVRQRIADEGLDRHIYTFDPDTYCPALPVVQNLLYATARSELPADFLVARLDFLKLLQELGLVDDLVELALEIMDGLRQIFGSGGTDHPLFQRTGLDPKLYDGVLARMDDMRAGKPLDETAQAMLLSVPSSITAEQVGPAFPDEIRQKVLRMRARHGEALRREMAEVFAPIEPGHVVAGQTVLENLLYGKLSVEAGAQGEEIRRVISQILFDEGVFRAVLQLIFDVPIALGGSNLSAIFAEPLAISRAVIKRPDVLVFDAPMASFPPQTRVSMINVLRQELPETTIIYLSPQPEAELDYSLTLELQQGRITSDGAQAEEDHDSNVAADLARKLSALEQTEMFAGLDRKQLRLLAFGARWYRAPSDEYVFYKNDPPDSGAYMIIEGEADLLLPKADAEDALIATVGPGTLVGELGLIRNEPRALDMRAKGDLLCLRLGVEEFLAVVEHDAATAFKLLQVVAGYVKT